MKQPVLYKLVACSVAALAMFGLSNAMADTIAPSAVSSKPSSCTDRERLSREMTPVEMNQALPDCIAGSQMDTALFLFALSGTYGRYDALRVEDKTSPQVTTILRSQAMQRLTNEQKSAFMSQVKQVAENPSKHSSLCAAVRGFGAPTYYPAYMVNHGMAAVQASISRKSLANRGLRDGFDSKVGWDLAVSEYLHCN